MSPPVKRSTESTGTTMSSTPACPSAECAISKSAMLTPSSLASVVTSASTPARSGTGTRTSAMSAIDATRGGRLTRAARVNLPPRVASIADMAEVRVPVPDRAGVLAEVTTLASELGVSIADFEIAHSAEGQAGVLLIVVPVDSVERFTGGLIARGYRSSVRTLE